MTTNTDDAIFNIRIRVRARAEEILRNDVSGRILTMGECAEVARFEMRDEIAQAGGEAVIWPPVD